MVEMFEIKWLRCLVRVSRKDRVRNEEVYRRAGIDRELASRVDQKVLKWLKHVERMDEYCRARRLLTAEVSGGWVQGRPKLGWMDGMKVALGCREKTGQAEKQCVKVNKEWIALVHMKMIEFHMPIFARFLCSFRLPSQTLVMYHLEWMILHDAVGVNCKKRVTTDIKVQVLSISNRCLHTHDSGTVTWCNCKATYTLMSQQVIAGTITMAAVHKKLLNH